VDVPVDVPFTCLDGHTVTAVGEGGETRYVVRWGDSSVTFFRRKVPTEDWLKYVDFTSVSISDSGVEVYQPRTSYPKLEDGLHKTGAGRLGLGEHTAEVVFALPHHYVKLRELTSDRHVMDVLSVLLDKAGKLVSLQASKDNPDILLAHYHVASFSKVGFGPPSALAAAATAATEVAKAKQVAAAPKRGRMKQTRAGAACGLWRVVVPPHKLRDVPIGKPRLVDKTPQDWARSPCWDGADLLSMADGTPTQTTEQSCACDALHVAAGKPRALAPKRLLDAGLTDRSRSRADPIASDTAPMVSSDTGVDLFGDQLRGLYHRCGFLLKQVRCLEQVRFEAPSADLPADTSAACPADASADCPADTSANHPADTSADVDYTAATSANHTAAPQSNPNYKKRKRNRKNRRSGSSKRKAGRKRAAGSVPTMMQLLRQPGGVYLVEFRWENRITAEETPADWDWHIVVVNCSHRYIFCNTMGYIPFSCRNRDGDMRADGESVATHENVTRLLGDFHDIARVWQLCREEHRQGVAALSRRPPQSLASIVPP